MNRTEKIDLQGYAFIRSYVIHTGVVPSLRKIGEAVGYVSPRSVQLMLERLRKRGFISYSNGTIRFPSNMNKEMTERTVQVPLVGSVACGTPTLAEQQPEALIDVSIKMARPGGHYFLLRAVGSSMNKSGIKDGNLVLIREQPTADEGQKVVALINDDATIKIYHREKDVIVLKPNSTIKSYKPIILTEDFIIQGVVVATLPASAMI